MKLSSQIKPISYLKAHAAEIVRTLGDRQEPLIITQNGEAKAVLQDIDSSDAGDSCAAHRQIEAGQVQPASMSSAASGAATGSDAFPGSVDR